MLLLVLLALADDPAPHHAAPHEGAPHAHAPPHGATVHHRFDDAARWSQVFDDPARDAWQKPSELVAALGIVPGSTVADVGAGTGYFNPHLAAAVGPEGTVLAIDIEPTLVAHMTERAAREGTPQVEPRLGAADDPGLRRREADLVMLVDTYHHVSDRVAYFSRLRKGVDKDGRLVIVDFRADVDTPVGPPREHRLPEATVREELDAAGWTWTGSVDLLPHQYVLVFER